jgi:regulator of cell morphogenesis and NO signaling
MNIEDMTLAQIVTKKPESAAFFENYNLDYCCKGKQKFSEVLINDPGKHEELLLRLEFIFNDEPAEKNDFEKMDLSEIVDYILIKHHQYVKEYIPIIKQHLDKVLSKHGNNYPAIEKINLNFLKVANDLEKHMMKEELILFPEIKSLESPIEGNSCSCGVPMSLDAPIKRMEQEHEVAGNLMAEIRELSNGYTPDESACLTHRVVFDELKKFELDLHQHVHIENNILFPRALNFNSNWKQDN